MDSRLLDALRTAPSLELYELSLAINRMLADPRRILEVRQHLQPGAQVLYYDDHRGTLATGRILQLQPTHATVQDDIRRMHWKLSHAAIVADPAHHVAQTPPMPPRRADMTIFRVGDAVSFTDKHLREPIGTITRLNSKTCSIIYDGEQWRAMASVTRATAQDDRSPGIKESAAAANTFRWQIQSETLASRIRFTNFNLNIPKVYRKENKVAFSRIYF
jgi:hypothetical protein